MLKIDFFCGMHKAKKQQRNRLFAGLSRDTQTNTVTTLDNFDFILDLTWMFLDDGRKMNTEGILQSPKRKEEYSKTSITRKSPILRILLYIYIV